MNKMKKLLLVVFLFPTLFLNAQTADNKFAIGLNIGRNEYNGDYGSSIWNFNKRSYFLGGLSLNRYLNPSFDLGLQGSFGEYGFYENDIDRFEGKKLDMSVFGHYKFNNGYILAEDSKLSPFVSLGLGFASYGRSNDATPWPTIITDKADFIVPVGLGLKYQISNSFAIQYQYLYNFTSSDVHDQNRSGGVVNRVFGTASHPKIKAGNDAFGEHLIGIVFSLNKAKDTDKDGIADKYDLCMNTALNVEVDNDGCPVDGDKDGVADYLDKCYETPVGVKVDVNGCPVDKDKDGVADYLDKCPDVAGLAKFEGCPDTDGDGIQDSKDNCPTVAGLEKFDGCPDTDGDGVIDSNDLCPTDAGTVNGCPDSDKDGVADKFDKCPNVFGIAANKGCPEVKAETKKIFDQALQGIQFETGKAAIKKSSNLILNKVVSVLNDNTSYELEIDGHTDSQGDDAKNLLLSQKRADAVKAYLISKGIDESRLIAKGFGETVPVADNNTSAGRVKNRRVEFKVNF